jgi:hypothetical protein
MPDPDSLLWGMIFGAIGMGYIVYGKNQRRILIILDGIALCVFPYFVSGVLAMCVVGAALTLLPMFLKSD